MPLIHIAMRAGKPAAYRQAIFDTLYRALRETFNVPEDDQFMTITEHEAANFRYSPTYLGVARSDDVVFIQITANNTGGPGPAAGGRVHQHRRGGQGDLVLRPRPGAVRVR